MPCAPTFSPAIVRQAIMRTSKNRRPRPRKPERHTHRYEFKLHVAQRLGLPASATYIELAAALDRRLGIVP